MPILLLFLLIPTGIAFLLALRFSGRRRWLAWGNFTLLALPVLIAGVGGLLLSANGLAWRSCVKLPCGLALVAGLLLLLVRAGAFLWKRLNLWGPAAQTLGQVLILLAVGFLCLVVGWYGMVFTAIWTGTEQIVERGGQIYVEEHVWMDSGYAGCCR